MHDEFVEQEVAHVHGGRRVVLVARPVGQIIGGREGKEVESSEN